MHGIIFTQLQKFINANYPGQWLTLLEKANQKGKIYLPTRPYPDDEIYSIVGAGCEMLGKQVEQVLEEFGAFLTTDLLKIYAHMIKPEWKALDLLENIENSMHKAAKFNNPGAAPPALIVHRVNPQTVEIHYNSERKMHWLGIGIIKAIASHYGEVLDVISYKSENGILIVVTKTA
jgi:hypothetical protein